MKKVDQFFNKKFQEQEFEFKDAYWADAQKLIEADKERRRRGAWFPWFLGIVGLSLLGIGWSWYLQEQPVLDDAKNESAFLLNEEKESTTKTTQNLENNSSDAITIPATKDGQSAPEKNKDVNSNSSRSNAPNSSKESATNSTIKNTGSSNSASDLNQRNLKNESGNGNATEKLAPMASNSTLPNLTLIPSEKTNQERSPQVDQKINSSISPKNEINTITSSETPKVLWNALDLLELKTLPLEEEIDSAVAIDYCYVKEASKWNLAWNFYSLFNTNKGAAYLWLGAATGPSIQYRLNNRLALQSDVLYRWRRGRFGASSEGSIQSTYSFGFTQETFRLMPSDLHQLDWPVYVQLRNRRQSLEAGISLQFNLGIRGNMTSEKTLFPWQRSSGPNGPRTETTIVERNTWIEDPNIRKVQMGLLLGYRYQVNKKISTVLQARYELNSIYKLDPVDGSGSLDGSPLHLQVGLTFSPFK